ncbi:MAG: heavy-metal-associated domain-containing protein, partial [Planctomycetota bacterium]
RMIGHAAAIAAALTTLTACEYTYSDDCGLTQRNATDAALLQDHTTVSTSPVLLHLKGMSCPKCVTNVDIQLARIPGVQKSRIDMATGVVSVDFDPSKGVTRGALAKAVDDSGLTLASIEGK